MRYVLTKGKDIISIGSSYYQTNCKFTGNYELHNLNNFEWIRDKTKTELENNNGKAKLKEPKR